MALHTCQIQQYDFHHCEQQFEKQCGKGERTLLITTVGIVFLFSLVFFDSTLQPRRETDEGVCGVYITST